MRGSKRKNGIRGGMLTLLSVVAVMVMSPREANAQILVDFNFSQKSYMTHEPIVGEVSITNNAGRDLVLANDKGLPWLDFRVTDGAGRVVTPAPNAEFPKPVILNAGQVYKRKVVVNSMYPMSRSGMYRVKPSVRLSQINQVFPVNRMMTVTLVDGQKMWSQIFGVPAGREGAGTYREYSLLTQHFADRRKSLYFRLADVKTGIVKKTYSIGDYMAVRPPKYIVDRENKLHVFHMSGAKTYAYTIIDVDGKALDQQFYVVKGASVPALVQSENGQLAVLGGMTLAESQENYESREFRNISERPPGLPSL